MESKRRFEISSSRLTVVVSVVDGLRIEQIKDAQSGTKWLVSSQPLFTVNRKDGALSSIDCDVGEVSWSGNSC
jgi:hypothetical protein